MDMNILTQNIRLFMWGSCSSIYTILCSVLYVCSFSCGHCTVFDLWLPTTPWYLQTSLMNNFWTNKSTTRYIHMTTSVVKTLRWMYMSSTENSKRVSFLQWTKTYLSNDLKCTLQNQQNSLESILHTIKNN